MATSEPKPTESIADDDSKHESGEDTSIVKKPVPVMTVAELQYFQDLGLGRGVDSSDPHLWQNKSPMQIKTITADLENIIATDESGIINRYEKTVSSLRTQQTKIQSSLSDPTSGIKIGLDAHYSQSSSSTVTVKGTKVNTRTISFRNNINELPMSKEVAGPALAEPTEADKSYNTFVTDLATWILRKLEHDQKNGTIPPTPKIEDLIGTTSMERLGNYTKHIKSIDDAKGKAIEDACQTFVFDFGITHYVSSIELGALRYSVISTQSQSSTKMFGGNIGAGSTASGSASNDITSMFKTSSKQEQEIGHFNEKGEVQRDTADEAVIGFQLQPISNLVQVSKVRLALIVALEIYLQSKTDDTVGPFLLSAIINKKPIYWKFDQEQFSLLGTEDIKAASLFYIISAGDRFSPTNFIIAYWGNKTTDRKLVTNMSSPLTQLRAIVPTLPVFLTTNTSLFDSSDVPLLFKYTFDMKTARYTVHSRIYSSFACCTRLAGPTSLQTVLGGDEFYIKHSPHFLKSVYLAIKQETGAAGTPSYTSTVFPNIKYADKEGVGMLFRLNPYQLRKQAGKTTPEFENVPLPII